GEHGEQKWTESDSLITLLLTSGVASAELICYICKMSIVRHIMRLQKQANGIKNVNTGA
ncbi:hypothetical protein HispidOSU_007200, partial [Sigmodon hispidus]